MHKAVIHVSCCAKPILQDIAKGHFSIGVMRANDVQNHEDSNHCVGNIGEPEIYPSKDDYRHKKENKVIFKEPVIRINMVDSCPQPKAKEYDKKKYPVDCPFFHASSLAVEFA